LGFTNEEANEGTITSIINMVQETRDNQISYCPDQGIEIEPIQIDEMDTLVIPVPPNASNPILREGDAGKKGSLADPHIAECRTCSAECRTYRAEDNCRSYNKTTCRLLGSLKQL
jgi:hypothetical protein